MAVTAVAGGTIREGMLKELEAQEKPGLVNKVARGTIRKGILKDIYSIINVVERFS